MRDDIRQLMRLLEALRARARATWGEHAANDATLHHASTNDATLHRAHASGADGGTAPPSTHEASIAFFDASAPHDSQ